MPKKQDLLSVGEAAQLLGCQAWMVARVYERGLLPEPPRVGRYRVISQTELTSLRQALRKTGYLKPAPKSTGRAGI